jgi:hypothetical protein
MANLNDSPKMKFFKYGLLVFVLVSHLISCGQPKTDRYPFVSSDFKDICMRVYLLLNDKGMEALNEDIITSFFESERNSEDRSLLLICSRGDENFESSVVILFPTIANEKGKEHMNISIFMDSSIDSPLVRVWNSDLPVREENRVFKITYSNKGAKCTRLKELELSDPINRMFVNDELLHK